jgi:general secretion pathway protein F
MRYQVKAVRDAGTIVMLECEAADAADASRQAAGLGCTALKITPLWSWILWRRAVRFPLVLFSQELAVLLDSGVPLVAAIETLAQKEKSGSVRAILTALGASLREGQPLSAAMHGLPLAFPPLYAATVRAAERTGDLPRALARYVDYQTRLEAVKKKIVNASIYPSLLFGVGGLVSLFLLLYVVPRFSAIYAERGSDLPLLSRLLIAWGGLAEAHAPLIAGSLAAALIAAFAVLRSAKLAEQVEALLWAWPSAAERMRVYQVARFYRTAGMLLRGGVPLVPAFEMSAGVLHARLRGALERAVRAIRNGRPAADSLESCGLTTPVASRMLAVGERGGNMGEMMERAAIFHEEELARWIDWFSRLFEPLLMALIGLVIGGIVVLMYMPIFELAGSIQ